MFRRIAGKTQTKNGEPKELYLLLSEQLQQHIRSVLLQSFGNETDRGARNKIGDAVAEIARQLADIGEFGNW